MLINLVTNGWMESLFSAPCYDEVDASWVNSSFPAYKVPASSVGLWSFSRTQTEH